MAINNIRIAANPAFLARYYSRGDLGVLHQPVATALELTNEAFPIEADGRVKVPDARRTRRSNEETLQLIG